MTKAGQNGSNKHNNAVPSYGSCGTSDLSLSTLLSEPLRKQDVIVQNMNTRRIRRSLHLGKTKCLIFHGPKGLVENIHFQEWENGKVTNEVIQLNVPKLVVNLNYGEFVCGAIKKTLTDNKNVLCTYHIGSGFLVL